MKRLLFIVLLALAFVTGALAQSADLPAVLDIAMVAGADYQLSIRHTDAAGVPIDLTGYTFAAQFRSAPAPTGALFATYSTPIVDAAAGRSRVSLSKAQTLALSGKSGVWDLLQVDSAGKVTYLRAGKATVRPSTTRLP